MVRNTRAQVASGTTVQANTQGVNPADLTSNGGQVQVGSSHQTEGTLGDVPMAGAPTFVPETPVGHVEGEVASQPSHNS